MINLKKQEPKLTASFRAQCDEILYFKDIRETREIRGKSSIKNVSEVILRNCPKLSKIHVKISQTKKSRKKNPRKMIHVNNFKFIITTTLPLFSRIFPKFPQNVLFKVS